MDWYADFEKVAKQDYRLETLKQDQFTGSLEIHLDNGIVKTIKVHNVLRGL